MFKFFHFHTVFGNICQIMDWGPSVWEILVEELYSSHDVPGSMCAIEEESSFSKSENNLLMQTNV